MTDSPDTLTPSQTRAVRLALDAGRYRNERDALRNQLAEANRKLEQLHDLLDDVTTDYAEQCDDPQRCACSMARAWRHLRRLAEVIS